MPRYEHTQDGSSKFWEVRVEGTTLTTRHGKIGARGTTTTKTLDSELDAQAAAARLIREKTGKGYVLVEGEPAAAPPAPKPAVKKARAPAKKPAAPTLPDFDGVDPGQIAAAAKKIHKKPHADAYAVGAVLDECGVSYDRRAALAWHMVRHGLLAPERHLGLLELLAEQGAAQAEPVEVAELCTRLPVSFAALVRKGWSYSTLLAEYPLTLDALLVCSYGRDPEAFRARLDRMPPNIVRALHFVQGRWGEALAPADAAAVLDELARGQANGYGLCMNNDVPLARDGQLVEHRLADLDALTALAARFGTREQWQDALLRHARTGDWNMVKQVRLALRHASAAEAGALLGSRYSFGSDEEVAQILDVWLEDRRDPPEALLAAALAMPSDGPHPEHAAQIREVMLFCAMRRYQEAGQEVPAALDEALELRFFPSHGYASFNRFALAVLRAVPRERVLAIARRLLAGDHTFLRAAGPIAAHFDAELLDRYLARCAQSQFLPHEIVAQAGLPALPALLEHHRRATGHGRQVGHAIVLECLATIAAGGGPIATEHEAFIAFDREGDTNLEYRDPAREARLARIVGALPTERRLAVLMDRIRGEKHPQRPMTLLGADAPAPLWDEAVRALIARRDALGGGDLHLLHQHGGEGFVGALERNIALSKGDANFMTSLAQALPRPTYDRVERALGGARETEYEALLRLAREAPGDRRVRVYVLQRLWGGDDDGRGYAARPGSRTVSGGRPPGLGDAAVPRDRHGQPLTHLFTLDLDDVPELRRTWPEARAIAFFGPEPETGLRHEESVWVPIPADSEASAPDGDPIAVVGLDVPAGVFDDPRDATTRALRKMIFNAHGHVLGEPLWIQEDAPEAGEWVMQVNDGLSVANTGDAGSLYVYTDGTGFQCH